MQLGRSGGIIVLERARAWADVDVDGFALSVACSDVDPAAFAAYADVRAIFGVDVHSAAAYVDVGIVFRIDVHSGAAYSD